jgi:hypothetical protein
MELIQTITVSGTSTTTVEFSSIPATYDDLVILISSRGSNPETNSSLNMTFNASGSGNSSRRLYGGGSGSGVSSTETFMMPATQSAAGATSNTFGNSAVYIPNYRSSNAKSASVDAVNENNATAANQFLNALLWTGTAAITSIQIGSTSAGYFIANSSFSLYGIRKFNTSAQPKATGGAISFDAVNNKWVHVFSTSGTFTPTANITCEYLVVAGGGSGGCGAGGGGGAGGYRSSVAGQASGGGASAESALSLTSGTNYTVTIGAGGASRSGADANGFNGSNSVFGSITATGGGAGAGFSGPGVSGGSGGGASFNGTGGAGTANQGFAGGGNSSGGGGGGGAGAVGGGGSSANGFPGGAGVGSTITGSSVTRGGGGGGFGSNGAGGSGGGGAGGTTGAATSGTMNTGSGGGGSNGGNATGAGGSGIVIVRYDA